MVRFTLRQCAYFKAVAEHGGIAQAARALNISQPSIAQALDKLEDMTNLCLFERHHARGLSLTLQGRILLRQVILLEAQAEQVEREAAMLAAEAAGEIRLGIFWNLAPFYAAGLLRSFADALPGVIVKQQEMSLSDLASAVRDGSIDLALTYDRGAEPDGLDFVELAALRPMLVLPADHRLAGQSSIDIGELANEPYVMFDAPGSRSYFEDLLQECGIDPPIAYVSRSLEAVRSAVGAGFGFTLLVMRPPSDRTYDGGHVVTLHIADDVRPLRIVLASRSNAHRGPILRRFTENASAYFSRFQCP
jgi:DNA-binding transcriptional LysR family regulator